MNRSPFPGMDPYLERFWLSVHNTLATYIKDDLNSRVLPSDLRAEMTERVLISSNEDAYLRRILPDVYVVQSPGGSPARGAESAGVAVAEPVVLKLPDDPPVEYAIHITDLSGERLITAIEVLSASNKKRGPDREAYLRKRAEYYAGKVNLVEIDLYRGGERTFESLDVHLPPARRSPYLVLVKRAGRLDEWEVYPLPLRQPVPGIKIPLRESDADVVLQLQPLLERVYANGRYPIDYAAPLDPPLAADDDAWADSLLKAVGRR